MVEIDSLSKFFIGTTFIISLSVFTYKLFPSWFQKYIIMKCSELSKLFCSCFTNDNNRYEITVQKPPDEFYDYCNNDENNSNNSINGKINKHTGKSNIDVIGGDSESKNSNQILDNKNNNYNFEIIIDE